MSEELTGLEEPVVDVPSDVTQIEAETQPPELNLASTENAAIVAETPQPANPAEEPSPASEQELIDELDELLERMKEVAPEYSPPPYTPQGMSDLLRKGFHRVYPAGSPSLLTRLRSGPVKDLMDADTWKGAWFMLNYTLEYQRERVKHRLSGEYETDEWGVDPEVMDAVRPFFDFLYKRYWRVEVTGIENIPEEGRTLLVSNHSGQLPFDGSMIGMAVMNEHPNSRLVRSLYASWFPTLPFVSSLFVKVGQTLADEENGVRLLEQEQLVAVFPEGVKGVGKLYKDRYHLARFGRGGFVQMALRTGSPMIPVAVVGAEETYISIAKSDFIARLIGFPFFPISVTFPWFGLLGFVPFPTKWYIDFGAAIDTADYGPAAAGNLALVGQLSDQVRNLIQEMLYARLAQRKSVLFG